MKSRNKQIEGLRAIAILLIMCFHFFCRYHQLYHTESPSFLGIQYWGNFGVGIFLLISTYYLSLMKSRRIASVIGAKVLRLWPAYFVCVLLIFAFLCIWSLPDRNVKIIDLLINILMINGFINIPYVDGAHWYIGVLLSLTLIFGLLSNQSCKKKDQCLVLWLVIDVVLFSCMKIDGRISIIARFLIGLIGNIYVPYAMIGYCIAHINNQENSVKYICGIIVGFFCILYMTNLGQTIAVMCSLLLFCAAVNQKIRLLENKCLVYFGEASYCIYLIHQNIGYSIMRYIEKLSGQYYIWESVFVVLLMTIVGICLHIIIEKKIVPSLFEAMRVVMTAELQKYKYGGGRPQNKKQK